MDGDTAQRGERQPLEQDAGPAAGRLQAGGGRDPGQLRQRLRPEPKKSAGRLSGARKAVTGAAYPSPHYDQTDAGPEAGRAAPAAALQGRGRDPGGHGINAVPLVDDGNRLLGIVSEADLLRL